MRFRRKAKLFPGVYLNFSKSGISTTIGVPGASINFGKQGAYLNTGIPGTGIYNRQYIGGKKRIQTSPRPITGDPLEMYLYEQVGAIKTINAEATTTEGLKDLKETLHHCYRERNDLKNEIVEAEGKLTNAKLLLVISYFLIFGFFIKWFKKNKTDKKEYLEDLENQYENCFINIDMEVDEHFEKGYFAVLDSYIALLKCDEIWDITSSGAVDQKAERTSASSRVTRRKVKFGFGNLDIIKSKYDALRFENANGGDLYIYPAFVAVVASYKKFGLVDIRELDFKFYGQRFIEDDLIPFDAVVVDKTWAKVNKDGSPDRRFKNNYQIPVCKYGQIELTSSTGLNEAYMLSSFEISEKFASKMMEYQSIIKSSGVPAP